MNELNQVLECAGPDDDDGCDHDDYSEDSDADSSSTDSGSFHW